MTNINNQIKIKKTYQRMKTCSTYISGSQYTAQRICLPSNTSQTRTLGTSIQFICSTELSNFSLMTETTWGRLTWHKCLSECSNQPFCWRQYKIPITCLCFLFLSDNYSQIHFLSWSQVSSSKDLKTTRPKHKKGSKEGCLLGQNPACCVLSQ